MGIRVQHTNPADIIKLGKLAGEARRAEIKAQREAAKEAEVRRLANQKEMAIFQSQLQLDRAKFRGMADFEAEKRAKLWEIEKMSLRSQMDFQEEEQQRARKRKEIDNSLAAIDKEVLAGRISEKEAYPIKLKLSLSKEGIDIPSSMLRGQEERFGVKPYWMQYENTPVGSQQRKLYEAQMKQRSSGERGGTVPWYLTPKYVDSPAGIAAQMENNIFLEDEERERMVLSTDNSMSLSKDNSMSLSKDNSMSLSTDVTTPISESPAQPSPAELRKQGTREAYEIGVKLGYWK